VETIIANPIHATRLRPFTRISSARPLHQIQLACFDQGMMDLLTMEPCTITPTGDGSLIQTKGMDDGLNWTASGVQGHHDDNELHRLT
jgi:hypothetical protein